MYEWTYAYTLKYVFHDALQLCIIHTYIHTYIHILGLVGYTYIHTYIHIYTSTCLSLYDGRMSTVFLICSVQPENVLRIYELMILISTYMHTYTYIQYIIKDLDIST